MKIPWKRIWFTFGPFVCWSAGIAAVIYEFIWRPVEAQTVLIWAARVVVVVLTAILVVLMLSERWRKYEKRER